MNLLKNHNLTNNSNVKIILNEINFNFHPNLKTPMLNMNQTTNKTLCNLSKNISSINVDT
jgi:hypothetical protein